MRKAIVGVVLMVIAAVSMALAPWTTENKDLLTISQIVTSSMRQISNDTYIGCPNMMHRIAIPPGISVENLWSDVLEATKIEMQKNDAFQREHYATGKRTEGPVLVAN